MRRALPLLTLLAAMPLRAQQCPAGPVALVLSGGGAKGLAHIGVLRALDSLGVRPNLIVGSSMGAVVGAMYASGYSGREIDSLARSLSLRSLFRTYAPRAPRALGALQPLVVWEQGERGFTLQSAAVREREVNALLSAAMLRGNLLARGDFDSLPIRFRAVATDLRDRSAVVLAAGDLARAVRASIAIPLIFPPERVDSRFLADGGLSANIPITIARRAGAVRVIVSDATERMPDSLNFYSPLSLADRLLGFLFQQPGDSLVPGDIRIRPAVEGFTSLDFSPVHVARLIAAGESAAATSLEAATCLPHAVAATRRLPSHLDTVITTGTTPAERRALLRVLGLEARQDIDVRALRARLRQLGESDAFDAVWLRPTGQGDTVRFDLAPLPSPRRAAALGLVYDNELGGRMWLGVVDRNLIRLAVVGSAALYLGELRREVVTGFRRPYQLGGRLVTPTVTAEIATEGIRRFDSAGGELAIGQTREARGFVGLERSLGKGWLLALGGTLTAWRDPARVNAHAFGGRVRLAQSSETAEQPVLAEVEISRTMRRAALVAAPAIRVRGTALRPIVRLGWGRQLPPQFAFPLGGTDGFPGLHIGERRGDREAMAGLGATVALRGPLVFVIEGAVGRSAEGGALVAADGWVAGARAGIGADTPVGPMRFEYGRASGGRDALLVRLGRWF